MVVDNLNILRAGIRPNEADPELSVDSDAVLTPSISRKPLKSVSRGNAEIVQPLGRVELVELPACDRPDRLRAGFACCPRIPTIKDIFRSGVGERLDHATMIARISCYAVEIRSTLAAAPGRPLLSPPENMGQRRQARLTQVVGIA